MDKQGNGQLQFGHGGDAVENNSTTWPWRQPATPGFNSATAVTPWRTRGAVNSQSGLPRGFNSATAVTPWRTAAVRRAVRRPEVLQLGHGGDAVETLSPFHFLIAAGS